MNHSFTINNSCQYVSIVALMREKEKVPVIIVGAGPAGLSAAYELAKNNIKSMLLEKDPKYVGGLAKTIIYKGFRFDLGGHRFFSNNKDIEALWSEILGKNFLIKKRLSRIYYNQKFYHYPLKPFDALSKLGFFETVKVLISYIFIQIFPKKDEATFENWVVNRFGRKLYKIFFKTYTEKVWGIPGKMISADWAAQRIKDLSLKEAIFNAFSGGKGSIIKTLSSRFRYPKYGPGMLWERVRGIIEKQGSKVIMGAEVVSFKHNNKRLISSIVKKGNKKIEFAAESFICSMALSELVLCLNPKAPKKVVKAAEGLGYRDFLIVILIVKQRKVFPDQWIYIHDPRVKVARIQNFKNWSNWMVPANFSCLGMEYFCSKQDEFWNLDDKQLIGNAVSELGILGLSGPDYIIEGKVYRVERAYPVYDRGYLARLKIIRSYLSRFNNLQVVGRNGMHRYNNQDHAMMTGILAAKNILGAKFNLWQTDVDEPSASGNGTIQLKQPQITP